MAKMGRPPIYGDDSVNTTVRFPAELLKRVSEYAEEHCMTRNATIVYILSTFLDSLR